METRRDDSKDGLQNYDIHREIARGSTSVVYLATCRRGRLRNRIVALKKITERSNLHSSDNIQAALHNSLYHPSIISLLGTFSTSSAQYHALELCPNGTLHDLLSSRHPPVLSEAELRGVLKSLVGAFVYLHKRHIIYGNIRLSKILLSEDYRVKLSDFGLAIQVESSSSTVDAFCDSFNLTSPEIIEHRSYGFPSDLWSLGCLAVTCLSGRPVFEASHAAELSAKILRCQFDLPNTVSYEARDLISGLLQINPSHRIPLHRILSHPFFNPSYLVTALTANLAPVPSFSTPSTLPSLRDGSHESWRPPREVWRTNLLSVDAPAAPSNKAIPKVGRRVFSDPVTLSRLSPKSNDTRMRSVSSYASLRLEDTKLSVDKPRLKPFTGKSGTRSSSAMSGATTPALTADSALSDSDSGSCGLDGDVASDLAYEKPLKWVRRCGSPQYSACEESMDDLLAFHPLLLPPKVSNEAIDKYNELKRDTQLQDGPTTPLSARGSPDSHVVRPVRKATQATDLTRFCTTSLNTAYLTPKTHKLANGNVTILPSKALLVDFREGERRKGRKGDQVLVIGPSGKMVKVYDAPHLSTPCCLAEATAEYPVEDIPPPLARQYADAAKVVDKLKQRIPKLILHEDDAQYTLMANEPFGDVEIMLQVATHTHSAPHNKPKHTPCKQPSLDLHPTTTRLRLIRPHRTIEISRSSSEARGNGKLTGSWTKRIIPTIGRDYQVQVPEEEADLLDVTDQEGVKRLYRFLRICEAVEKTANPDQERPPLRAKTPRAPVIVEDDPEPQDDTSPDDRTFRAEHNNSPDASATWISVARSDTACDPGLSAQARPLGSIRVVPRPPKLRNTSASLASNVVDIGDSRHS